MARTAKVLEFERDGSKESVKVDPGGAVNKTAEHVAPPGVDAPPLPGDYAEIGESSGKGTARVAGYYDHRNTRLAEGGEFRIYGRDSDGSVVNSFWLKGDGTIVVENDGGTFTFAPSGQQRSTFTDVELIDGAGQPIARVGDLLSVIIQALMIVIPEGSSAGSYPVVPALGIGAPLAGAGQIISGRTTLKG